MVEIIWWRSVQYKWIVFKNTTLLDSWLDEIVRTLKWEKQEDLWSFPGFRIYDIWLGIFLISYDTESQRDTEKTNMLKYNFEDNTRQLQFPEFKWDFNYNWKYYNIISIKKDPQWETTDILYNGIVVNTQEFIAKNPVWKLVQGVKDWVKIVVQERKNDTI